MKKPVLLLAVAAMTAGCQTALHQYDGVLGYSSTAMPDGRFLISYTAENRASWADMEKDAHAVCARTLNVTRESARLLNLKKETLSQNVDMPLMTAPGKQENGVRELQLKRITAECVRDGKAERAAATPAPAPAPSPAPATAQVQPQSKAAPQPGKNQSDACVWIGGPSPQDKLGCKFFREEDR